MDFSKRASGSWTSGWGDREPLRNLLIFGFHFCFLFNLLSGPVNGNKIVRKRNLIYRNSLGSFLEWFEFFAYFFRGKCDIVWVTKAWFSELIIGDNLDYFPTLFKAFHHVKGFDLSRELDVDLIIGKLLDVSSLIWEIRVYNDERVAVDLHGNFCLQQFLHLN